jgi:hypothetical protein
MATEYDKHRMRRLQVTFAELRAALLEADMNTRGNEVHLVQWPSDIGFVIGPSNEWLASVSNRANHHDRGGYAFRDSEIGVVDPELLARISELVSDQQRLLAGWRPSPSDLASAPVITPDSVFVTPLEVVHVINLVGHVRNVPGGGPDRRRITSPVTAFDADQFKWVRTLSRFYRLDRGQAGSRPDRWPTDGEASRGNNSIDGDER